MTLDLRGGRTRQAWALAAAAVVVLSVVVVVIAFGLVPYPDVPRLADRPAPPVTADLAYVDDTAPDGPCLHVVDGMGEDRELGCGPPYAGGALVWLDDDRLALESFRSTQPTVDVIDVATGEVIDTISGSGAEAVTGGVGGLDEEDGTGRRVVAGADGEASWVEVVDPDGSTRRILELDGPSGYRFFDVGWTQDGRWIVARDSIQRVLVVAADGASRPRTWAEDVSSPAVR